MLEQKPGARKGSRLMSFDRSRQFRRLSQLLAIVIRKPV
jgi:hypothetical protein